MMLIQTNGKVYFIDKNNSIFHVNDLSFPHPKNKTRNLKETLIDGVSLVNTLFFLYQILEMHHRLRKNNI
jgi:mRNA-capping enzyme